MLVSFPSRVNFPHLLSSRNNCFIKLRHKVQLRKHYFLFVFFFFYNFIYLFLALLGLCYCSGFSLVVVSRGYPLVVQLGLLSVVSSLVAQALYKHRLESTDSVGVAHGLSCSAACGIFPDQGSNLCLLLYHLAHCL